MKKKLFSHEEKITNRLIPRKSLDAGLLIVKGQDEQAHSEMDIELTK